MRKSSNRTENSNRTTVIRIFDMKHFKFILIALISLPFISCGCTKGDSDLDYGEGYVYIAQALSSGGLNNVLTVPSGWGTDTWNFRLEDETVKVFLSVVRSGKLEVEKGFTVDVAAVLDEAQASIDGGIVENAVLLSGEEYSFPSSVTVPDGEDYGTFYLEVPYTVVLNPDYAGKNLVAAVSISNPTAYTLSESNTSVVVAINVDGISSHINNNQ